MKEPIILVTLLLFGTALSISQSPDSQPHGTSSAGAVADSTVAKPSATEEALQSCQSAALHQPAYEFCQQFAVLVAKNGDSNHELGELIHVSHAPIALANAYSIYKSNMLAKEAMQKAAINNGQTKQAGSPAGNSGSTSLVAKAAATNLLSVAVESGALTEGQTGNTITLQTNPASLFREAYLGTPQLSYLPVSSSPLENFTVSVGIAANANSTTSVPTTGSATSSTIDTTNLLLNSSATKLSSVGVNYEFRKMTQERINKYLIKKGLNYLAVDSGSTAEAADKASVVFTTYFVADPASGCDAAAYKAIAASSGPVAERTRQFVSTFDDCFAKAAVAAADAAKKDGKDLDTVSADFNTALQADIASFQKSIKDQISGWDLAAQYVFNKPVGQPETHDFRLIGSGDIKKSQGSAWTVNAAASLYQSLPSGAQYGRLKDAQFSGELDKSWGSGPSAPVIGLAGYGQYQSKPTVLDITSSNIPGGLTLPANSQAFLSGTQGWLGVVQVKTTVRVGTAQIPLAVKWSNKPNLLGKSKLGAQFGVSYDFSQLKQLIGKGSSGN